MNAASGKRVPRRAAVLAPAHGWRIVVLAGLLVLGALAIGARLGFLQQTQQRAFLKDEGDARTVRAVTIQASRGVIRDRRGELLAVSAPVVSFYVNPQTLDLDPEALAALGQGLGVGAAALRTRIAEARDRGLGFLYLKRRVAPAEAQAVRALELRGIETEESYRRYYPAGEVSAHVVGLTNIDDQGIEGLELAFDEWLTGQPGQKRVLRDRRGHVIRDLEYVAMAEPGQDLELALDLRVQYLAHRELKAAITQYGARSGSVVVLDNQTGEILAMANQPAYNPNDLRGTGYARLRNRAVTDLFEPGSTVKPLTIAAALETGRFQADQKIDTRPGWVHLAGKTIKDPRDYGVLDLGGILAKSSQVGITRLAEDMSEEELRGVFARFGLGAPTGVSFPGEAAGRLPGPPPWPTINRLTFAFGYGLSVTTLQLAQAYTVFANGGAMATPSLLRVPEEQVPPLRPVLSPAIAQAVAGMLEGVVRSEGTAVRAAIPGYRVAGKTGTARKLVDGSYNDARHLAYFVGFAPASHPRVTAVVLINEPEEADAGGGLVAAPVFSRVVGGALRLLGVAPDLGTSPQLANDLAAGVKGAAG
ncbi:MAG: penicillin-binding protein 2 [Pseudomonadales bacterium]|nr:penicillin-binding protein 2 [Pseudomonadales bacterium]